MKSAPLPPPHKDPEVLRELQRLVRRLGAPTREKLLTNPAIRALPSSLRRMAANLWDRFNATESLGPVFGRNWTGNTEREAWERMEEMGDIEEYEKFEEASPRQLRLEAETVAREPGLSYSARPRMEAEGVSPLTGRDRLIEHLLRPGDDKAQMLGARKQAEKRLARDLEKELVDLRALFRGGRNPAVGPGLKIAKGVRVRETALGRGKRLKGMLGFLRGEGRGGLRVEELLKVLTRL